ncbi:hypothetical protein [Maribacter sp. Hel_I_7]|uniref:hypothetical protein n=1 Tax=Maribacter sp. Hel_I_7 TaxID=1249997 RepID=UPI00047C25ED|nr:hypothetical protein [Maribacter sp. Hel_I_7]
MILKEKSNFLIVGTVRNVDKTLELDVNRLTKSIGKTKNLSWFFVESDSDDDTLKILKDLNKKINNFNFISLGNLTNRFEKRTERLAFCRNRYVEEIQKKYPTIDFVIVADLDNLNKKLTETSIDSCFKSTDWDMLSANQNGPYYDIWALRHKTWCPNDCWETFHFYNNFVKDEETNMQNHIYSKMIKIPSNTNWIEVDSAFGGFAIYKRWVFDFGNYNGVNENNNVICEHVHFHKLLKDQGAKLFINPNLINANYTEMTLAIKPKYRNRRRMKNFINSFKSR